mgnify:CR=1 FL=1
MYATLANPERQAPPDAQALAGFGERRFCRGAPIQPAPGVLGEPLATGGEALVAQLGVGRILLERARELRFRAREVGGVHAREPEVGARLRGGVDGVPVGI